MWSLSTAELWEVKDSSVQGKVTESLQVKPPIQEKALRLYPLEPQCTDLKANAF